MLDNGEHTRHIASLISVANIMMKEHEEMISLWIWIENQIISQICFKLKHEDACIPQNVMLFMFLVEFVWIK